MEVFKVAILLKILNRVQDWVVHSIQCSCSQSESEIMMMTMSTCTSASHDLLKVIHSNGSDRWRDYIPRLFAEKKKRNNSTDATDKVVDVVLRQHH